jgi:hypothetical protein
MKSVLKNSAVALAFVLLSSSCAKTFYSVDGKTLAQKHHQSVAVIPSLVSISSKGGNRKAAAEALERQEAVESLNFQQAIYEWMLKSKSEGKITVAIQDIESTNAKLKSAGYPETLLSDAKICEILGVDGIIISNFELYKPFTESEAMYLALSTKEWGYLGSDEVNGTLGINDCANNKLIWSYQQKLKGYNPKTIVNGFMKKAGKKMPYVK